MTYSNITNPPIKSLTDKKTLVSIALLTAVAYFPVQAQEPQWLADQWHSSEKLNTVMGIYPHFIDDYDVLDGFEKKPETLVSNGVELSLQNYLEETRLTFKMGLERSDLQTPGSFTKGSYEETLYDFEDRFVVDRQLVVAYDPDYCTKTLPEKPRAVERFVVENVCWSNDSRANDPYETRKAADELRGQLKQESDDYALPNGTGKAALLALPDEALLDAILHSGEVSMRMISEIPKITDGIPGQSYVDINVESPIAEKNGHSIGRGPFEFQSRFKNVNVYKPILDTPPKLKNQYKLTPKKQKQSPKGNDEAKLKSQAGDIKIYDPKTASEKLVQDSIRKEWLARLQAKKPKSIVANTRELGGIIDLDKSLRNRDYRDLTPAQRSKIEEALRGKININRAYDLDIGDRQLDFLTGFTMSRFHSDAIGITFYKGGRVTEPIFFRLTYWIKPIFGVRAPFSGTVRGDYTQEMVTGNPEVKTKLDLYFDVAGQNVGRDGRGVFEAVGLPEEQREQGHEFVAGIGADATFIYNLPVLDEKKIYFDEIFFGERRDYTPPLGQSQTANLASIMIPATATGLKMDAGIGQAGLNIGAVLKARGGQLVVDVENTENRLRASRSTLILTGGTPQRPNFSMTSAPGSRYGNLSTTLILDNPRYQTNLSVVPAVNPYVNVGVGRFSWEKAWTFEFSALAIQMQTGLGPHEGVNNRNLLGLQKGTEK